MDLRLKALSQANISAEGQYVVIASDGKHKVQVFTAFQPGLEIDEEFTITTGKIKIEGK